MSANSEKVAFVGDIGLLGRFQKPEDLPNKYFDAYFDLIKDCRYVIGNLEVPVCSSTKPHSPKSVSISAPIDSARILNFLKINVVSLANNHMYDFGGQGLNETIGVLKQRDIQFFGLKADPLTLDIARTKLHLYGSCNLDSNPNINLFRPNPINITKVNEVRKIRPLEGLSAFCHHSGEEHVHYPSIADIRFCRDVISKPFDFYIGHHPHVIQGIEKVNGCNIFYSLGNFLFDNIYRDNLSPILMNEDNLKGLIVIAEIMDSTVSKIDIYQHYIGSDRLNCERYNDNYSLERADQSPDEYAKERSSVIAEKIGAKLGPRDRNWIMARLKPYYAKFLLLSMIRRLCYKYFYQWRL